MAKIKLSIIIPSYNETENLRNGVLSEVEDYLKKQKYSWEVLVSDDGSPDAEARRLAKDFCGKTPGFRFLENKHAGKPFALWSGVQKATGEIVLFSDMDQSTPLAQVEKLLPFYEQGYDVVIGSRGTMRKNSSAFRLLASTIFREIRRMVLLGNVVDTQCGFKSCRLEVAKRVFPMMQIIKAGSGNLVGWKVTSYDVELLFAAQKLGYKIAEVPVDWENRDLAMDTKKSSSKGKFVKESLDMLKELWRVKINDIKGYYK
jgi:dolichyl-phosphate beta-glucosyltransferase